MTPSDSQRLYRYLYQPHMANSSAAGHCFRAVAPPQQLLISGSPHNSLATTNLVYLYQDVADSLKLTEGSFVKVDKFVWKLG